jgi:hypothetical protein
MPKFITYVWHALIRMDERQIDFDDIRRILDAGETIERYPDDTPYPSRLLLGWIGTRPVHVVIAEDAPDSVLVVTVYDPRPEEWSQDFRSRKP